MLSSRTQENRSAPHYFDIGVLQTLQELHHRVLSLPMEYGWPREAVHEANVEEGLRYSNDISLSDNVDETGNHIVAIIFSGNDVFELDGDRDEPTYLGRVENERQWSSIAVERLKWLSDAAYLTGVHNDIHAVLKEDLDE